jgi:hypothetical protein
VPVLFHRVPLHTAVCYIAHYCCQVSGSAHDVLELQRPVELRGCHPDAAQGATYTIDLSELQVGFADDSGTYTITQPTLQQQQQHPHSSDAAQGATYTIYFSELQVGH